MLKDSIDKPKYPVTYRDGPTGAVWGWIFWWARNGEIWVKSSPSTAIRKRREKERHSVLEEIQIEAFLLFSRPIEINLKREAFEGLLNLIDNPPPPNKRLLEAAERYHALQNHHRNLE